MEDSCGDAREFAPAAAEQVPQMTARTVNVTWLVLVTATVLGWLLADSGGAGGVSQTAALIMIACVKIYLVMAIFMGLWRSPAFWHGSAIAWVFATGVAIFVLAGGTLS